MRHVVIALALGCCAYSQILTKRNLEAPFCYVPGGERSWPITRTTVPAGSILRVAAGDRGNFRIETTGQGRLRIVSSDGREGVIADIQVDVLKGESVVETQTLHIRPAPPTRPITYYADFGDDLINIFGAGLGGARGGLHHQLREGGIPSGASPVRGPDGVIAYDKEGFDQYFRRLQCQGVAKEILWLMPFPFITDHSAYDAQDWKEYKQQALAIIRSPELGALVRKAEKHLSWGWLRDLMVLRLDTSLHKALSDSAVDHGIALGVSYRPFEHAASKYYEVPVFDATGKFLRFYHPLATPSTDMHPDRVGFAHYREVLRRMGRQDDGELYELEFSSAQNSGAFLERYRKKRDNLRIVASRFPPIQADSFVLVRLAQGSYDLMPWAKLQARAEAQRIVLSGFQLSQDGATIRVKGLRLPTEFPYLLIDNPSGEAPLALDSGRPVRLRTRKGGELGRTANYFSLAGGSAESKKTHIAGITVDGEFHPAFFATETALRLTYKAGRWKELRNAVLVVNRGEVYSSEMVDYNLAPARRNAVREIAAVLKYPAFRFIYVNTRSHTQLAADSRDGVDGVRPAAYYDPPRRATAYLGIDLAYAPQAVANDPALLNAPAAELSSFSSGEWSGYCQTEDCPYLWRAARVRAVASGVRKLVFDLKQTFPATPIHVVVPEREAVATAMAAFQRSLAGQPVSYSSGRYNYIQNIGEGVTRLDLTGTDVAPVLLGVGAFVSPVVLEKYLDTALADLRANHGSSFRRPRAIMFEGQYGLKDEAGRRARVQALCAMLARKGQIGEVVLYEAADWIYRLPWSGFDFLDRCTAR
ncbi:MAG: hypothetical protein IT168_05190 [Bryobacterales bacterium]|nr:hypothetical protein [Bryobacterales bacterium]